MIKTQMATKLRLLILLEKNLTHLLRKRKKEKTEREVTMTTRKRKRRRRLRQKLRKKRWLLIIIKF
jgi:hypothetical protein